MRNLKLSVWVAAALGLVWIEAPSGNAQAIKAQLSDLVVPAPQDELGRSVVLRGKGAKPLSGGQVELSGMRVELMRGAVQDLLIEATNCVFDSRTQTAFSAGPLTVRKPNESLLIQGTGFQWQHQNGRLLISNAVQTVIRKELLQTGSTNAAAASGAKGGSTNAAAAGTSAALTATNAAPTKTEPVRIFSDHLDFRADLAVFSGNVRATDEPSRLRCGKLTVFFDQSGGDVQKIEAEREVVFEQDDIRTTSDKAVYLMIDRRITLTGQPRWQMRDSEGSGDLITVNNRTRELRVERQVSVKIAPEKALSFNVLANAATNRAAGGAERVSITAAELDYRTNLAVFRGAVRVTDPSGGALHCERLRIGFAPLDAKMQSLEADDNVEIVQGGAKARGQSARYAAADAQMTLAGNPTWSTEQGEGRSDLLRFDFEKRQMIGQGNVLMKFAGEAAGEFSLELPRPNTGATNRAAQPLEISSDHLFSKAGSAIFVGNVRVTNPQAATNDLRSEVLAAFFRGDHKLDQLIAEENIQIRQGNLQASGQRAVYWVADGWISLTGNPALMLPNQKYTADEFIIDRVRNSYRIKGNYRIEVERVANQRPLEWNPKRRTP